MAVGRAVGVATGVGVTVAAGVGVAEAAPKAYAPISTDLVDLAAPVISRVGIP